MAMLRPTDWKGVYCDPRTVGPETDKRLRSGFWRRDCDFETDTITWTCDKRKMNDKVAEAMLDREFAEQFARQGMGILDTLFGEGTAEAYRHKTNGNDRVSMRFFDDKKGRDDMALWYGGTTATGTSTCNTITTSGSTNEWFDISQQKRYVKDYQQRTMQKGGLGSKKPSINRLARIPFKVEHGGDLLSSLQREFDRWAKPQMGLLHG